MLRFGKGMGLLADDGDEEAKEGGQGEYLCISLPCCSIVSLSVYTYSAC